MAIQKMKLVFINGPYKKLSKVSETLIDFNYFQPERALDYLNGGIGFTTVGTDNPYSSQLTRLQEIIDTNALVAKYTKKPKKYLPDDVAENLINSIETELKRLHDEQDALTLSLSQTNEAIDSLSHFSLCDFDISELKNLRFLDANFGRLPKVNTEKLNLYDDPYAQFFVASSDAQYDWGVYFSPKNDSAEIHKLFSSLFFSRIELPSFNGTCAKFNETLIETKNDITAKLDEVNRKLEEFIKENTVEIIKLYNQVGRKSTSSTVMSYAAKYHNSFMLIGWIPENDAKEFNDILTGKVKGITIKFDNPENNKNFVPPTRLKNRYFFRPFQYFVEIYGVPNYKEVDPTVFIAITYTLLYGIMFADVGQGIVLTIAGYLMHKFKKMPLGKILMPCGVMGAFFGLVFGSVFGFEDALNPLYKLLGFSSKPFDIMENATTLLAFSIGIGVALLIVAMIYNVYSRLRRHDFEEGIFGQNGIMGIILYCSILTVGLNVAFDFGLSTTPFVIFGIILPLVVIFFKKPLSSLISGNGFALGEGVGDYILENFFELFEIILSYFTNTLSFLRVGAFVLIHSGIMTAFFALAEIMGGTVPYIIMIIFGNIFVIALEGLLVGIQVLRLEFYEMFSRFYEGDGRMFSPLTAKFKEIKKEN